MRQRLGEHVGRLAVATLVVKRLALAQRQPRAPGALVGDLDRVAQSLCGLGQPGLQLGLAQLPEQLGVLLAGRMLGERTLEDAHSSLGGAAGECPSRRRAQQGQRGGIGVGRRHQQMGGDLLLGRAVVSKDLGRAAVRLPAGQRRHRLPNRGGDQWVHERQWCLCLEDVQLGERAGGLHRGLDLEPRELRHAAHRRPVAQDRERTRHVAHLGRHRLQARDDRVQHRFGRQVGQAGAGRGVRRRAGRAELIEQLDEQERVAVGDARARLPEGRLGAGELRAHHRAHAGLGERLGPQHVVDGCLAQCREGLAIARKLALPDGDDQRDRQFDEPLGQIREEPQRWLIGPLRVVDQHHQRLLRVPLRRRSDQVAREPEQPVDHRIALVARERAHRQRRAGEQLAGPTRGTLDQALALGRVGGDPSRLEQLDRDPEREVLLQAGALSAGYLHAGLAGHVARDRQQPRLAEAGRRLDEHRRPAAAAGLGQALLDRGQFGIALHEYAAEADDSAAPTRLSSPSGQVDLYAFSPSTASCGLLKSGKY